MSVILFGVEELANVVLASTAAQPEGDARLAVQRSMAHILAFYAQANAAAYNARYREEETPVTAIEILECVLVGAPANLEAAQTFAKLAMYNTDDFATDTLRSAIAAVTAGL